MTGDRDQNGRPRVEDLLRWSAQYEPEDPAPADLVWRAAAAARRPQGRLRRVLIPAAAVGLLAALVGFAAGPLGRSAAPTAPSARGKARPAPVVSGGRAGSALAAAAAQPGGPPAPRARSGAAGQASVHRSGAARRASGTRAYMRRAVRAAREPSRTRPARRPPAALWRTRLVQEYRAGVLAPVLLTQSAGDGAVDVAPAMVDIPLDEGLGRPGGAGPAIRPAGYSQEDH